jgi:hypothetical protein
MKNVLSSLFFVLALAILVYSAMEAGAPRMFTSLAEGRTCCSYQVDCAETQTCVTISPACSKDQAYICKDNLGD